MTKASKKPSSKKTLSKKPSAKKSTPKKAAAKKPVTKARKKPTAPKTPRSKARPTPEGEHVKVAQIVMPTGRIRKRAVWGVKDQDGRRVGEVAIRGKRFQVEQVGTQWKVVKELAAAAA